MNNKKWGISFLLLALCSLLVFSCMVAIIDPFFHYHQPLKSLQYLITSERYQNNGILKNFEYDAIITGTSMTENFKASEFDELFGTTSVKVPLAGALFKETGDRLRAAFQSNDHIRFVLQSLDYYSPVADKDQVADFNYPEYLYDKDIFNDVNYLLNKSAFHHAYANLKHMLSGNQTTSFDEYANWNDNFIYSKESVLKQYIRPVKSTVEIELTESEKETIRENIEQNILSLAEENPDTQFYLFFPPYSIVHWDLYNQSGSVKRMFDIYQYVTELLLAQENIAVFSFDDQFDIVTDLNHYKDQCHYGEWINAQILEWIHDGTGRLTYENYEEHFEELRDFYTHYEYDALFS